MPRRSPEFRTAVWARINSGAGDLPWREYARRHASAVLGAVALALISGGILGHERARAHAADDSAQLATAYVRALDPRAMQMP